MQKIKYLIFCKTFQGKKLYLSGAPLLAVNRLVHPRAIYLFILFLIYFYLLNIKNLCWQSIDLQTRFPSQSLQAGVPMQAKWHWIAIRECGISLKVLIQFFFFFIFKQSFVTTLALDHQSSIDASEIIKCRRTSNPAGRDESPYQTIPDQTKVQTKLQNVFLQNGKMYLFLIEKCIKFRYLVLLLLELITFVTIIAN